jgi:hypothetical protein|tara:strand:- start:2982 stop:3122 length:141 start_codon:yes stop_codon:yes gene_type:complete
MEMKKLWSWLKKPYTDYKQRKLTEEWKRKQDAAQKETEEKDPFIYD